MWWFHYVVYEDSWKDIFYFLLFIIFYYCPRFVGFEDCLDDLFQHMNMNLQEPFLCSNVSRRMHGHAISSNRTIAATEFVKLSNKSSKWKAIKRLNHVHSFEDTIESITLECAKTHEKSTQCSLKFVPRKHLTNLPQNQQKTMSQTDKRHSTNLTLKSMACSINTNVFTLFVGTILANMQTWRFITLGFELLWWRFSFDLLVISKRGSNGSSSNPWGRRQCCS